MRNFSCIRSWKTFLSKSQGKVASDDQIYISDVERRIVATMVVALLSYISKLEVFWKKK